MADSLTADDFYFKLNRLIYDAMQHLAKNKPFDVLTVSDMLKTHDTLDQIGGETYLYDILKNTPTAANIVAYADIVRDRSVQRQLIAVGTDIAESGFTPEGQDVRALLDQAEQRVFQIAEQGSR